MIHSFQGSVKPAFGPFSAPVRFGGDATPPAPDAASTPDSTAAAQHPAQDTVELGATAQPASADGNATEASEKPAASQDKPSEEASTAETSAKSSKKEEAKLRRKHNFGVAKGVFFRTVVPFASIGLWMLGIPGMVASMGVSYVSGRLGRRAWNKIDDSKLTGTALKTRELINTLADPANIQQEDEVVNKVNGVLDEALSPAKLAAIPLIGGLLSRSAMIANALKTARIPYNSGVANLMRSYIRVKQVRAMGGGAAAAAQTVGGRAFFLLNAAGANHAVAQIAATERSNLKAIPKATWAAAERILFLSLVPKLIGPLLSRLGGSKNGLVRKAGDVLKESMSNRGVAPPTP